MATLKSWGALAWVPESERNRILNVPFGQFKNEIKNLEREIREYKKKNKSWKN